MAETTAKPHVMLERDFSSIILTLDNVLIPEDKLSPTPSMQDGLDLDTETDLRILGCELIQTAGILLKLPQVRHCSSNLIFSNLSYLNCCLILVYIYFPIWLDSYVLSSFKARCVNILLLNFLFKRRFILDYLISSSWSI